VEAVRSHFPKSAASTLWVRDERVSLFVSPFRFVAARLLFSGWGRPWPGYGTQGSIPLAPLRDVDHNPCTRLLARKFHCFGASLTLSSVGKPSWSGLVQHIKYNQAMYEFAC
jgi:hypothetical protein